MNSSQHIYNLGLPILMCLTFVVLIAPAEVNKPGNSTLNSTTNNASGQGTSGSSFPMSVHTATFVVSTIGATGNLLLIGLIIIDPLKILRRGPWMTIMNLAMADMLTCLTNAFMNYQPNPYWGTKLYTAMDTIYFISILSSFFLLTFLTVEVYTVTKFPLKIKSILTRRRVVVAAICIWLLGTAMGMANTFTMLDRTLHEIAFRLVISWVGLLELAVAVQILLKILIIVEILESGKSVLNNNQNMKKHKNIAKTVMLLNLILLITAVPYFVAKQLEFVALTGQIEKKKLYETFPYYYAPIATMNFVANPFIYGWRLPDYRRTLLAVLKRQNRRTLSLQSITLKSSVAHGSQGASRDF